MCIRFVRGGGRDARPAPTRARRRPAFLPSRRAINARTYAGTWDRAAPGGRIEEFVNAYDFADTSVHGLNVPPPQYPSPYGPPYGSPSPRPRAAQVTLFFNDTTEVSSGGGPRAQLRVSAPLADAVDACVPRSLPTPSPFPLRTPLLL